jgi:hypothetical protein
LDLHEINPSDASVKFSSQRKNIEERLPKGVIFTGIFATEGVD